jgi:ATP adenylyltransferase
MRYVSGESRSDACIFCSKPALPSDAEQLIVHRGRYGFIIMNLYPYNSGHVMVVPNEHVGDLSELEPAAVTGLFDLLPWATECLRRVLKPDGFNIGLNLGSVAGAGVADHLHIHIVPRWQGDANFMPIIARTMVMPELLPITYAKLRAEFEVSAAAVAAEPTGVVAQAGAIPVLAEQRTIALRKAADDSIVLPKGHIEDGEAAYETTIREIDEEMGLYSEPAGWGGVLDFQASGATRRVAYLLLHASPGPEFDTHLGVDTFLFSPDDAVDALTHDPARELLRSLMPDIERLMTEAQR